MTVNTNPADQSQAQSSKSSSKKPRRRLDHMRDLADGQDQFDMVPRKLSRAYIDGKFPESKFRLILCMLSHSDGFHVKRAYLEERFSPKSLVKYLKELKDEGYIEVESMPCPTGGTMKLYHVRSLEYWALYRHSVDPSLGNGSVGKDSLSRGHKDTDLKDSKEKDSNNKTQANSALTPPSKPKKPKAPAARKPRSGVLKVTKSRLNGELGGLYETVTKQDVIRATVDEMLNLLGGDHEAALEVIKLEKEKPRDHLLQWGVNHSHAWRDRTLTFLSAYAKTKSI